MAVGLFCMMFIKRIPAGIRGVIALLFGFVYACAFTNWIDTPQIKSVLRDTNMTGHVYKIDSGNDKSRLYIKTDDDMRVRVSMGQDITIPNVGDKISGTATLFRPAGKYAPETFDYARWAYFNKLSATGYITDYQVIDKSNSVQVNKLRDEIHTARNSFLIDALVLGYKNTIPENDNEIWTATGIGHVWSISGFHMTLVGGWLFAIFFLIFRSIPYVTRRIPARIPAMCAAWILWGRLCSSA
jgi:predicted membrane metal-binding protein